MSLPENLLWRILRQARGDLRFRRQHPIGPYVADFYCPAAKLVIEIDGAAHQTEVRGLRDNRRDRWMHMEGLQIVRLAAADVLSDPDAVADALYRLCKAAGPSTTQRG
jgi:very-short-patch-repair endonuclease